MQDLSPINPKCSCSDEKHVSNAIQIDVAPMPIITSSANDQDHTATRYAEEHSEEEKGDLEIA
jgi:hypothetical protein